MAQIAKAGDNVQVHYTGKLTDGTVFDSSVGREPLAFPLGKGMVIKGFDDGITGMQLGEKKTVTISVEEAYGPVDENQIFVFERSQFPDDIPIEQGVQLNMHNGQETINVVIADFNDTHVVLDANHPLAGQELIFDIELVGISPSSSIIMP
ncbi:MAG: peptidylprolyl isomerase [Spirosomataceae bacterium]